ncbi:phosphodiesterase [compost metagenome]
MRIGVVSDTHLPRFGRRLPSALVEGLQGVDRILHLGDLTAPEVLGWLEAIAPVTAIAGNNDPPELHAALGRKRLLTLGGVRIGMVHGDGKGKTTLERALAAFEDEPLDLLLFGHSHQPYCARHGDRWVLNPGSPTDKRRMPHYSYALVDLAPGSIVPEVKIFDRRD